MEQSGALEPRREFRKLRVQDRQKAWSEEVGEPELVDTSPLPVVPCFVGVGHRGGIALEHGDLVSVGGEEQGGRKAADTGTCHDDVHVPSSLLPDLAFTRVRP